MFTADGIDMHYTAVTTNVAQGSALVNGAEIMLPIYRFEKTATSIKVYLYLSEAVVGTITRYRLYLFSGKVYLEKTDNITKDGTKGLLVLFETTLTEV